MFAAVGFLCTAVTGAVVPLKIPAEDLGLELVDATGRSIRSFPERALDSQELRLTMLARVRRNTQLDQSVGGG